MTASTPSLSSGGFLSRPSRLVPAIIVAVLIGVPIFAAFTGQTFYVALFARLVIYGIAASALNLALGYGGLIGFGHALFMGLGAYSVSMLSYNGISNGWLHLAVAIVGCLLAGALSGAISLRTKGIAFIMITLAFSQIGYFIFVSLKQFGGDDGMSIDNTSKFGPFDLGSTMPVYVAALIVLFATIYWLSRVRVAPFGMVLRAGQQNARRVNAIGLPVMRYQLTAYMISAAICGIAGMLLANLNAFASPGLMSWQVSGELIVMIILGGMSYAFGPLIGAMVFLGLDEIMKNFTEHWMAIFGPLLVIMAISGRAGVLGLLARLDNRIAEWRAQPAEHKHAKVQAHREVNALVRQNKPGKIREHGPHDAGAAQPKGLPTQLSLQEGE